MARRGARKVREVFTGDGPTPEQVGAFEESWQVSDGSRARAMRRKPIIKTMLAEGTLDPRRYELLAYYADQAALAERSPVRSCCDNSPRGGNGPGVAILSAQIETGRIERDLGALRDIARAIAVDNLSLSQWCVLKHGGRERYGKGGKFIAIVPVNERKHMDIARMELRMAADRITLGY